MKKMLTLASSIAFAFLFLATSSAHATVGGPTYVYNLRIPYGSPVQEIMYVSHSLSGKGCPPEVYALNVETLKSREVVGCDFDADESVMQKAFAAFPVALKRLHLPYNNIRAETTVARFVKNSEDAIDFQRTDFQTKIYQDTYDRGPRELATLTYSGCYPEQAHIIEGYVTPQGYLLAFVVSSIGDCFEGGYLRERIFPVKATRVNDNPITVEPRMASEPALVDADAEHGNLLTFAKSSEKAPASAPAQPSTTPSVRAESGSPLYAYYIIIALLVVAVAGLLFRRFK